MTGAVEDTQYLRLTFEGMVWSGRLGLWLLWLAAILTFLTGADYFRKALPHLKEPA